MKISENVLLFVLSLVLFWFASEPIFTEMFRYVLGIFAFGACCSLLMNYLETKI